MEAFDALVVVEVVKQVQIERGRFACVARPEYRRSTLGDLHS